MGLDKDCCLETYSEAFREGQKAERERFLKVIDYWLENDTVDFSDIRPELEGKQNEHID